MEHEQKWSNFIMLTLGCMIGVLVMLALIADAHMLKSVLTWVVPYFCVVTIIYAKLNDWPLEQSFFYAVDTGCSIGFGAFEETNDTSRAFTVVHILLTDSLIVFGAFQLFLQKTLKKSTISNEALQRFYRQLTRDSGRQSNKTKIEKSTTLHQPILLLLLYYFVGVLWGMYRHRWSFLNSLYFAVSALSSVGLETPHTTKETGFLREDVCRRMIPLIDESIQHKQKQSNRMQSLSDSTA